MIGSNVIVDLSHHNGNVDLKRAKAAGIVGVIQKATQGVTFTDQTFAANREKARDAGLLFGAYHFGVGGSGIEQADFFLNALMKYGEFDLAILDFEANPSGGSMSLQEAEDFVLHVKSATGQWPGLYSGHFLKEMHLTMATPVLSQCWLWISQYGPAPVIPQAWSAWTMWQYTDGFFGIEHRPVDGIGTCDRDTFNGTLEQLTAFWESGGADRPEVKL